MEDFKSPILKAEFSSDASKIFHFSLNSKNFLEFFRAPDPQIGFLFFQLTFGQIISVIFLIFGTYLFFAKKK